MKTKGKARIKFSEEDAKILIANGESIQNIPPENTTAAWEAWAHEFDVSVGLYKVTFSEH